MEKELVKITIACREKVFYGVINEMSNIRYNVEEDGKFKIEEIILKRENGIVNISVSDEKLNHYEIQLIDIEFICNNVIEDEATKEEMRYTLVKLNETLTYM